MVTKTLNLKKDFICGKNTFVDKDAIIENTGSVIIGSNCIIRAGVVFRPEGGEIHIGDNCVINHYCVFHGKGGIYIGDWTIISPQCGFYAQNHSYQSFELPITKQPNTGKGIYLMGDNWIGSHTVVCDDVTLGKGTVIGANSTVTSSLPMGVIAFGSPARIHKKRYEGPWDFNKVERAAFGDDLPPDIREHVTKRGEIINEFIDSNDEVLDVGCGEGVITSMLAQRCRKIIGCDYSLEAIVNAQKSYPDIEFIYSNSTNLRFEDAKFSKVILSDVPEHLLKPQLIRTLKEAKRVLREGGKLMLVTPLTSKGKMVSTYSHIYEYSDSEITRIIKSIFKDADLINKEFGFILASK